ncbi:MAG: molecular chaperone DnaK, partial [Anaerolineae bacterium]
KDVEAKAEALKAIKDSGDLAQIRQKTQDLGQALQQVGAAAYEQAGGGPGTPPPGGADGGASTPPDEDVVDGEFSEA